jgi:hypothetical protein
MKQVLITLFISIPKVEIKIGYRGPSSVTQGHEMLYDRGAVRLRKFDMVGTICDDKPDNSLP